jgi:hypothetical protein
MGIGLGYILRMMKDLKLSSKQLKIGWYLSTASLLFAFFGPAPMGDIDYKFNSTHAAHYAAFAPIAWNIFFGWIIFVSQFGYKSELADLKVFCLCVQISRFFQTNSLNCLNGAAFSSARVSLMDFTLPNFLFSFIMLVALGLQCIMDSSRQL